MAVPENPASSASEALLDRRDLRSLDGDLRAHLREPDDLGEVPARAVRAIIDEVRGGGDAALRSLTARFDGCALGDLSLEVSKDEIDAALRVIPRDVRSALEYSAGEIRKYHATQLRDDESWGRDGVTVTGMTLPVASAGCYVPGGRAPLASTALMTAIPARVAGVERVVVCTPPDREGAVAPAVLAAAAIAEVDAVYRVGGAQAIAAMAFGTETVAPVDVIVGPGNAYVAAAKREVSGVVGIESIAGPSELVVIADHTVDPALVAADLMAQAEHGPGGSAILVTWDASVADAVEKAMRLGLAVAPRADEIASTLATGGFCYLVRDARQAMELSNAIAPEHLQIVTERDDELVRAVRNAGAVFCGPWTPAVLGDYVIGVNHVLPTARTARYASALSVDSFRKHVHVVSVTQAAMCRIGPYATIIAEVEGLSAHAAAISARIDRSTMRETPG